jgi:acetyltransferase-like isoleucine patch superfamily enzyme
MLESSAKHWSFAKQQFKNVIAKAKKVLSNRNLLSAVVSSSIQNAYFARARAKLLSFLLKRKLSNKDAQIEFDRPFFKVSIIKEEGAKFIVKGRLKLVSHQLGGNNITCIRLAKNSTLEINGDFVIGNGVQVYVHKNGVLRIGGKKIESEAGITCNSSIYVYKKVEIGTDFLCAWNVFITDCDWHPIEFDEPSQLQSDVIIGDHVWIAHDCSILKGTKIGNGSAVGCKSLLSGMVYPGNSLIAGIPAKVIKGNCKWKRDLPEVSNLSKNALKTL